MTLVRLAPAAMLAAGVLTTFGAVLWWGLTYWQVWAYDYVSFPQAGKCLVADSTICRLAASLCTGQHRALVSIYSPVTLWAGALLLAGGLGVRQTLGPPTISRRAAL